MAGEVRYVAHAFHESLADGRAGGELAVNALGFQFRLKDRTVALPMQGIAVRLGGANDHLLFLEHPACPGWSVYTADLGILGDPRLAALPAFAALRGRSTRRRALNWTLAIAALVAVVGLPLLLLTRGDWVARSIAAQVPPKWERTLGDTALAQVQAESKLYDDAALARSLQALTAPLLVAAKSPYEFRFRVARDDSLNAFALPGGAVVIHSGLILQAHDAAELLGVLGHEIAHVTERHGLRSIVTSAGLILTAQALLGDVTGLLASVAAAAPLLLNLSYSRRFEDEADEHGVGLLVAARIDPTGLLRFFDTLKAEEEKARAELREAAGESAGETLEQVSAFLSTHPATADRIAHLRRLTESAGGPWRNLDTEFQALQQRVRELAAAAPATPTANGESESESPD